MSIYINTDSLLRLYNAPAGSKIISVLCRTKLWYTHKRIGCNVQRNRVERQLSEVQKPEVCESNRIANSHVRIIKQKNNGV